MIVIKKRDRLVSFSFEEMQELLEEEKELQKVCSEPIDSVKSPRFAELFSIIEDEVKSGW